jgi:hypothetical protein
MDKKIVQQEISLCQEMYKKQKGCTWGKCKDCGVLLLLHKLQTGKLIEDKKEIQNFKKKILNQ